jgi:cytochrome c-type biogenesis protein CcmF
MACSVYTIVANASYIWVGLKGKLKLSGGSVAHVGFGMILLGILISASKKEILSYNTSGIFTPIEENKITGKPGENLTLVKGVRTDMGKYWVTYLSEEKHPKKELWYYNILFEKKDGSEKFTLRPNAFVNYKGNESLMANPSSRHYLDHDVFTYITALPDPSKNKDTASFTNRIMSLNDTLFYSKGFFVLERLISKDSIPTGGFDPGDIATVATVKVFSNNGPSYTSELLFVNKKGNTFSYADTVTSESLVFRINKPIDDSKVELAIKESNAVMEYLTLKAYMFPFINLLWAGVVIMVVGMIISMVRRISLNRKTSTEA